MVIYRIKTHRRLTRNIFIYIINSRKITRESSTIRGPDSRKIIMRNTIVQKEHSRKKSKSEMTMETHSITTTAPQVYSINKTKSIL